MKQQFNSFLWEHIIYISNLEIDITIEYNTTIIIKLISYSFSFLAEFTPYRARRTNNNRSSIPKRQQSQTALRPQSINQMNSFDDNDEDDELSKIK